MNLSKDIQNNCLIMRLKGDLDMHSVPEFKDEMVTNMEQYNLKILILNLKNVKFIDSSGLGAILGRYRVLKDNGGRIIIVGLTPRIERIFELSGVLKLMPVYKTETEALESIKEKGGNDFA